MEIRLLRYFVTVAETRHFGQAAQRLHMAQSPLSAAVRQLEAQLGATLFDRTTRRVELTAAGRSLLRDAEHILQSVEAAQARVQLIAGGSSGLLRVGTTGLAAFRQLPQLARIAARETPGLVLRFLPDLLTPAQELALSQEQIDLAVLRPPLRGGGLSSRLIVRERLVLALPQHHRLAGGEPVGLAELRDEQFVVYGVPDSVVDTVAAQACLHAGFLPRRSADAPQTAILLTLVAAGLGVALLPETASALHVDGVVYQPIAEDVRVDLALAWRTEDRSPALAVLLDALEADGFLLPDVAASPSSAARPVPSGDPR